MSIVVLIFILSPVLSLQETANPSMPYVLAMVIPAVIYRLRLRFFNLAMHHVMALFLLFSGLLSCAFGSFGILDIRYFKYVILVVFYICVTTTRYTEYDFSFIAKNYIIVAVGISLLIFLSFIFGYTHGESSYFLSRYSVGIIGVYKNPNYLTSFVNVALYVLIYRAFFGEISKLTRSIYVLIVLFFVVSDYLSGTRASLMLAVVIVASILLVNVTRRKKIIYAITLLVIILLLGLSYQSQIDSLLDYFMGKRSAFEDEGRTMAWSIAIVQVFKHPIFGCGLNAWDYFGKSSIYLEYLHNVYLELLLNQGFLGLLLCLLMIFDGCLKIKKSDRLFVVIFMIVTGCPLFFQNGLVAVNFWRFIIINRLVFDYSRYSKNGIAYLVTK